MKTLQNLNAADAFAAFPQVRGHILEAAGGTGQHWGPWDDAPINAKRPPP